MNSTNFAALLTQYTRRIRASAGDVADEIGVSRETINKWKKGLCKPSHKHRNLVLACAKFLRLTEPETREFLKTAGFEATFEEAIFTDFIHSLFDRLSQSRPYSVIVLLIRACWHELPCKDALLAQAINRYLPANVLDIQPPYSPNVDANRYFSTLGKQCQFKDVSDDAGFEQALVERLENTQPLFLFVNRFERSKPFLREQLAATLGTVSDIYPNRLHIILCGAEKMAALKYQNPDELPLLDDAVVEPWPELGRTEVYAWRDYHFKGLALDEALVDQLLTISGGHPCLLNECLGFRQHAPDLAIEDYPKALSQCESVWPLFTSFLQEASTRQQLSQYLQQDDLGKAQPYIIDPLVRQMYWRNLLRVRERRLCWRCEALLLSGREVLDN